METIDDLEPDVDRLIHLDDAKLADLLMLIVKANWGDQPFRPLGLLLRQSGSTSKAGEATWIYDGKKIEVVKAKLDLAFHLLISEGQLIPAYTSGTAYFRIPMVSDESRSKGAEKAASISLARERRRFR